MPRIAGFATLFAICLAAAAHAQSVATIQQLNDKWTAAFNQGDAAAVAAMYAPDASVLPPGGIVKGSKAIEVFWQGAVKQLSDARLTTVDVLPPGRRAAREIGRWLLATDIWNTDK